MLVSIWTLSPFAQTGLSKKDLAIAWLIKVVYAAVFMLVFSEFYGHGNLYGDAGNFIKDSQLLNTYAWNHPLEYLKIMSGLGDSSPYFEDPILHQTSVWSYGENGDLMNDNRLIIRLNSLFHFFSFGNNYVHGLIMSALSFMGILLIFQSFKKNIANKRLFFYALIIFPSIGFWGSGITKESLLILALGLFFFGLFKRKKQQPLLTFSIILIAVLLLLLNKPHVGLIVLGLSPFLLIGKLSNWNKWVRIGFPIVTLSILIALTYTPQEFNLLAKISYKQKDLINMGKGGVFFVTDSTFCAFSYSDLDHFDYPHKDSLRVNQTASGEAKIFGDHPFIPFQIKASDKLYAVYLIQPPSGSYIETEPINYSRLALLKAVPSVLLNTLIRPFPWDNGGALKHFGIVNNLSLIAFMVFTFFNRKQVGPKEKYIITYLFISAFLILLIIGWTTPIFGAIARYKMVAELMIIVLLFMLLKPLTYVKK